ncbi:hypothetical protein [Clostridium tetani]|uniref:hypothetical protein n=1 Tax=Clostridium tetani TaxID=1513 RepID=UPI0038B3356E
MEQYEEEHIEIIKYLVDTSKTLIEAVDYIEKNLYQFKTREILTIIDEGIESVIVCKKSLKVLPSEKSINKQVSSTEVILHLFMELRENFYDGDVKQCFKIIEKRLTHEINLWKNNLETNLQSYTIN